MSSTPYFSGPRVWMDSWFSLLLYSQAAPISITTRDSGSSFSLLRKRWSVSWFFSAGARNNKGFITEETATGFPHEGKKCPSYPGFEGSPWIPGSASVVRPLEFPESSGNLKIKLIIFQDPWIQCCSTGLLWTDTLFLGTAGKISFDNFAAGVVSTTDATSILLLVRSDLSVTPYVLHWERVAGWRED